MNWKGEKRERTEMTRNKTEFEHARQRSIELLQNMDCEDVVKSILLVLGDYCITESESKEKAKNRASYITGIIYYIASTETMEALEWVYTLVRCVAMDYAKCEKGDEA